MSDRDDLKEVQSFLSELIANLKTASAREGTQDTVGGLFPNGINDIFAKLTIGGVALELEVSAANSIHGPTPTLAPGRGSPLQPRPTKAVRPMFIEIPQQSTPVDVEIWFKVTQGTGSKQYGPTSVGAGTTEFDLNTGQVTAALPE